MRINPDTGLRVADAQAGVVDYFYQEFLPPEQETLVGGVTGRRAAGKKCATSCSEPTMARETGRNDRAQPHRPPRGAADGRGRHRGLCARQAQGGAPGRHAGYARAADQRGDRRGAAGPTSRSIIARSTATGCAMLRETAVRAMRELAQFNPYLTGLGPERQRRQVRRHQPAALHRQREGGRALPHRSRHPLPGGAEPAVCGRGDCARCRSIPSTMTASRSRSRVLSTRELRGAAQDQPGGQGDRARQAAGGRSNCSREDLISRPPSASRRRRAHSR